MLSQARGDTLELGYFSVKNYSHETYGAHYQNWFITQDIKGFMYAGNGNGVLEYDGESWRLISSSGLHAVRTVVVDENNVKWVGADRELGFLKPDSLGFLQFKSLKDKIPPSVPLTGNVWQIFPHENRMLFFTENAIYSYSKGRFDVIPHPGPIHREYQVNGEVYVKITGRGMFKVYGNSLQRIADGEKFKDIRVDVALAYGTDSVLFASREAGLFIYDGTKITPMDCEIADYLKENNLYAAARLPDSSYAFATLRAGVVVMDRFGKHIGNITTEDGILNNQVHRIAVDKNKALWLALQTGISQIETYLPYTLFNEKSGLEGTVSTIVRHENKLYAGTYNGLFELDRNSGMAPVKFHKIDEIRSGCFSLLSVNDGLLAATANGVFLISEKHQVQINSLANSRVLFRSRRDSDRIYIGHMHGLSSIYFSDGKWRHEKDFGQINEHIFSIAENDDGTLWLGTSLKTVVKVVFPGSTDHDLNLVKVDRYENGLSTAFTNVYVIDDEILVTGHGEGNMLFLYDDSSNTFSREAQFGKKFGLDSLLVYPIGYQNNEGHILLQSLPHKEKSYRFIAQKDSLDGSYSTKRIYDEQFRSTTESNFYCDHKNLLWLGGEQIARYDLGMPYDFMAPFNTYIRKVTLGQDSLIYGGDTSSVVEPIFNYSNGGFRFEFAAPSFANSGSTTYQYLLVGLDDTWSDWMNETKKDYTNLPEGDYRFLARAQNLYGTISNSDVFRFKILPPWYRTWWAYLSYFLMVFAFIGIIIQWRSRQLRAKNEALEKLIAVRTSEVRHQANQLKIQAEKLQELDKAKSRFFANISHEFRTPLTLIKGPIERLEQNFDEKLGIDTVKMIRRNANRLLNMVNQLLDLSKIDEGSLKLAATEGDVYKCLRTAASSFNSYAAQRNMDYRVEIPHTVLWASFDRDKLENIVYNLLGNAFKFSEDNSQISFVTNYAEYGLQIQISDAGKGIAAEKLPFIFDRFYQVDSSNTREKGGSGIGLSLSKDLVALMDGTITASSEVGKGTFFTVQLPIQEIKTRQKKIPEDVSHLGKRLVKTPFALSHTDKRNLPTILLVEDNRDMRHFLTEQLVEFYKVKEAVNGETGLEKAIANPPDLIITDLMMPKMDGIELCKKLKTDVHTSHIPVIMLTAKAGTDNKIEGLETGADDYLTKPFDGKELLVRTKNLIEQRKKLRELYSDRKVQVDPKRITVTSIDEKFLEQVLDLLEDSFPDPDFGVQQMQGALAMSKTQLHRKLKALTNEAPGELLRNFRLKKAAQLLSQKADSVTQIAYKVGFNNLSYFAKCFKNLYGVAPSSY